MVVLFHCICLKKNTKNSRPCMGRELLSRVTTQIPRAFHKPQALPVLRPPINAGSRLSLTTAVLNNICTLERGSSGTIFHPPPRPVLSSSGSLHWGCVCTYPFTGNHYTKNILKYCLLCQVDSNLKSTQAGKNDQWIVNRIPSRTFQSSAAPDPLHLDETDGISQYALPQAAIL